MATEAAALPFAKRLKLYLDERFPLATHLVVVFAFFLCNYFLADRLLADHRRQVISGLLAANPLPATHALPGLEPAHFGWPAIAGMVTVLLSFFLLRVFDEFKDYDKDVIAHPERVVSRGIMPLGELRIMGFVVGGVMAGLNALLGIPTLLAWGLVLIYSWLMFKEFYVPRWLNRHLFIYALSHQVITPLLCVYVYILTWSLAGGGFHATFGWQILMGAGTGLGWEMARKIRMPEEEHPQIDTYSKIFGAFRAAAIALFILLAGAAAGVAAGVAVGFPAWTYGLFLGAALTSVYGFARYFMAPTNRGARKLSDWAAILMLFSYIAVAAGSVAGRGVLATF